MPRSIKKGPFVDHHLLDKVVKASSNNDRKPILIFFIVFVFKSQMLS